MNLKLFILTLLLSSAFALQVLGDVNIRVQTKDMDGTPVGQNWRRLAILLTNESAEEVNMKDIVVEYKIDEDYNTASFTSEDLKAAAWYYSVRTYNWSQQGGSTDEVEIDFAVLYDHIKVWIRFNEDRMLPGFGQAEIKFGVHRADWEPIDETLDPSYQLSYDYQDNATVFAKVCELCRPDLDFDVHFVVLDDQVEYGDSGRKITDADLKREVDQLNRKFITEFGHKVLNFRFEPNAAVNPTPVMRLTNEQFLDMTASNKLNNQSCIDYLRCNSLKNTYTGGYLENDKYHPVSHPLGDSTYETHCAVWDPSADSGNGGYVDIDGNQFDGCNEEVGGVPVFDKHAVNVLVRRGLDDISNGARYSQKNINVWDAMDWVPFISADFTRMNQGDQNAYFEHEMGHAFSVHHMVSCTTERSGPDYDEVDVNIMAGGGDKDGRDWVFPTPGDRVYCPSTYPKELALNRVIGTDLNGDDITITNRRIGFYVGAPAELMVSDPSKYWGPEQRHYTVSAPTNYPTCALTNSCTNARSQTEIITNFADHIAKRFEQSSITSNVAFKYQRGSIWDDERNFTYVNECTLGSPQSSSCQRFRVSSKIELVDGIKMFIDKDNEPFLSISWEVQQNGSGWRKCEETGISDISNNHWTYYCKDTSAWKDDTVSGDSVRVTYKYYNGVQRERIYTFGN